MTIFAAQRHESALNQSIARQLTSSGYLEKTVANFHLASIKCHIALIMSGEFDPSEFDVEFLVELKTDVRKVSVMVKVSIRL